MIDHSPEPEPGNSRCPPLDTRTAARRSTVHADTFTITEAAQRTGLTMRALRYYEDVGLITPLRTSSRARVYSGPAIRRLDLIAQLRSAGVELSEIAEALPDRLEATGTASLADVIKKRLTALDAQRVTLSRLLELCRTS